MTSIRRDACRGGLLLLLLLSSCIVVEGAVRRLRHPKKSTLEDDPEKQGNLQANCGSFSCNRAEDCQRRNANCFHGCNQGAGFCLTGGFAPGPGIPVNPDRNNCLNLNCFGDPNICRRTSCGDCFSGRCSGGGYNPGYNPGYGPNPINPVNRNCNMSCRNRNANFCFNQCGGTCNFGTGFCRLFAEEDEHSEDEPNLTELMEGSKDHESKQGQMYDHGDEPSFGHYDEVGGELHKDDVHGEYVENDANFRGGNTDAHQESPEESVPEEIVEEQW